MHPLAQQRVVDVLHPRPHALLDALDRRFGGQAAVDRLVDPARPALVIGEHAIGLEDLLMLAGSAELRLLGDIVDLLAHLSEGGIDTLALGLDVVGDGMLDDDARLVEDGGALGHAGDELEARQAKRTGAAEATSARPVDQPRGGDHLRQHHGDRLERLDLDLLVAARLGVLDSEHADRAFEPNDRDSGEAVVAFLAGLGPVGERGMLRRLGEVEDAAFGGDGADQPLAHAQSGDVHRLLAQPMRRKQFEIVVAQEVDRADVAVHCLGDEVDDAVELGLRRAALRHDVVETGQDLAGGGGGGGGHAHCASRKRVLG